MLKYLQLGNLGEAHIEILYHSCNFWFNKEVGFCLFGSFFLFLAVPRGMRDLSFPIEPVPPAVEVWSPNDWTTREVPVC